MKIVFPIKSSKKYNRTMSFSYTVKTRKSITEVIEELPKHLQKIGFGVLGSLNFQKILTDKGIEFERPYQLLEVCNPKLAKQVLDLNPDLGLLLIHAASRTSHCVC